MLCTPTWFTLGRARHSVGRCREGAAEAPSLHLDGRLREAPLTPSWCRCYSSGRRRFESSALHGLLEFRQPAQRGHNVEAITVAEHAKHRHRPGELLEVFGSLIVGHRAQCDSGV